MSSSRRDNMFAVILAGGLGTRLRPVLSDRPKSMATVAEKPLLEHLLLALRAHGVRDVVLCVGHMADAIENYFGDGTDLAIHLNYAREERLLGTAGALLNARPLINGGAFFAMNGDTLIPDLDYSAFTAAHQSARSSDSRVIGSLVVVHPPDAGQYGTVHLDSFGRNIIQFREKAPVDPAASLISGGIYILEPDIFAHIPQGRPVSIEYEVFPGVLAAGWKLRAFHHEGFFGDIGTPEGLGRVNQHLVR